MLRKLCHEEKGYTLVTVALLLMFIVVPLLALVVDIGYAYVQQWQMQNAADAGALAGTRALFLEGADPAKTVAVDYARRNGAKTVEVTPEAKTVRVEAKTDFPTFFASILGIDTLAADKPAAAIHGAVSESSNGLYPIAIDVRHLNPQLEFGFAYNTEYDMYVGAQPGNFGWLSWNGTMSEGYLCESLTPPGTSYQYINPDDPKDHAITVGDWVWGRPGVANSIAVRDALDNLQDSGTLITIVAWDDVQYSGSDAQYHVAGFAEFVITYYHLPSQNKIKGYFQKWVINTNQINPDGADFGVHGVKLTE